MKKAFLLFICLCMANTSYAKEPTIKQTSRPGKAAGYSSRDATLISMMGWGVGLAVGIATFFALMDNNATKGDGGGGGGGGHSH